MSESIQRDIVTFAISRSELAFLGVQAHSPATWPAQPPQEGKGIILGGFRGFERIQNGLQVQWGFCHGLGPATSVHQDTIAIQFEREEWEQIEGLPEPQPGEPWGGVSGGPVFAMYEGPPVRWSAVAVIKEFSQDFEIIFASMLTDIRPNGTFG